MFNFTCQSILDTIAPLTLKKPKPAATPWLNDTTRAQRRVWRQAERRWKKDRLQISLEMLRDSQQTYQKVIPQSKLVTKGDRAFAVTAPKLWNKLPLNIKSANTIQNLKALLKTQLFTRDNL
ncbi:hypothetical protein AAFF_G00147640 [Aldrovandia affinis]|uniref:Uncharacterized protein n=1 Tax=Aldrovandia affinis TaxID=143900 RepID=A0AAD7W918_9TELE|nr:hypothetical protein AAFF_G00147640 [Aldrovandia affinis]